MNSLRPLADMPLSARQRTRGVLADIDDTLSTHGRLSAAAYVALERLRAAGKLVIPITGRPAGWCDHIARMWPVDGVVGENGAFYMHHDDTNHRLVRRFVAGAAERAANDPMVGLRGGGGRTPKIGSIPVNGWWGGYNSLAMTRMLLSEVFALDL